MVQQKDTIKADAKCQTHIAYNDFFPIHRELIKDKILLCLQNCIFHPLYTTIAPQQDHKKTTIVMHNGLDHFLTRCLWKKDVIGAHAKCQTHIAHNDFSPVHRQLVKYGILLCLQNFIFQLLSYRIEAAFDSNYGEHKGLAVLTSELSKLKSINFYQSHFKILPKKFSPKIFQSSHIAICWILAQTRELGNHSG